MSQQMPNPKMNQNTMGMNRAQARFGNKIKPKNLKGTIIRLLKLFARTKGSLTIIFISVLIGTIAALMVPLVIGYVIDQLATNQIEAVNESLFILMSLYLTTGFTTWFSTMLVAKVSGDLVGRLREELFYKLELLPLKYFDLRAHGDIMSRFTNDLEAVSEVVNQSVITLFTSVLTVIGTIIIMIRLNLYLAVGVLISVPLIVTLSKLISQKTIHKFKGQQKSMGRMNAIIEESVGGLAIIHSYNQEEHLLGEFKKATSDAFVYGRFAQLYSGLLMPLMNVINNLTFAITGFLGGYLVIEQVVTVGVVASFIGYSRQFVRPLNELSFIYNSLMAAIAGAERVFEVLDEVSEERNTLGCIKSLEGELSFNQVSFGYEPGKKVLDQISFKVRKGQKVAIVGPTGSGKTTMVNVLAQFYRHDIGDIVLDGINITDYEYAPFIKQFGIVLQDSYLFSGTIYDNIAYGSLEANEDQVHLAAKFAMVHDIIMKLPNQYETQLTFGGLNLSHGERQLITIARAVLANPAILILDEATSSVDLRTEKKITEAMTRLMEGRTSFVIAHRLSTIKDADLILVLKDGKIIEQGNHYELMAKQGLYAQMIQTG